MKVCKQKVKLIFFFLFLVTKSKVKSNTQKQNIQDHMLIDHQIKCKFKNFQFLSLN